MNTNIFKEIGNQRAFSQVVAQVKDAIRNGDLSVGDRLPSERELAELLHVSRVTVRDALRILEAQGLITVRVGARGGAFVTAPVGEVVSEGLTDMLTLSDLTADEVTEVRHVLEIGAVPLVCERATSEDFEELEELCRQGEEEIASGTYDMVMSAEFHMRLIRATHNRAMVMFMEVLQDSVLSALRQAREAAPQMGEQGVKEHRQIVEALKDKDIEGARTLIQAHLGRTAQRLMEAAASRPDSRDASDGGTQPGNVSRPG